MTRSPTRLLLTLSLVAACDRHSPSLPAAPPVVEVGMREYAFDFNPSVPSGRVIFRARNRGRLEHQLYLVTLPEESPTIVTVIRSPEREVLTPVAFLATQPPGDRGSFAYDISRDQRYALICLVRDSDDKAHAAKGMAAEFRGG